MRPLIIEMKGFSAFREATTIDLTDVDLFALVGATGSGKSTVLDAITFALFGSVARYEDNRAVAPVVNQTSNEARVSLTFEINGARYVAVRVVRRTATGGATTREARLECGADILAADARSMTAEVEKLLGLNMEQFNRTVVLPQGRFADFLHDDPAKRQTALRQLLGLDIYAKVGQEARQRAKRHQDQADVLASELSADAAHLTDGHRAELAARLPAIATARTVLEAASLVVENATAERNAARDRAALIEQRLDELGIIQVPAHVGELDTAISAATTAETIAAARLTNCRAERQQARDAVAAGPDLVAVRSLLQRHDILATLRAELTICDQHAAAATAEQVAIRQRADAVRTAQAAVDQQAEDARTLAESAQSASTAWPSVPQIDLWLELHRTHHEHRSRWENAEAAVAETHRSAQDGQQALATSVEHYSACEQTVATLREDVGIAAHAGRLAIGEPCPLCQQHVHQLPDHRADAALAAAVIELRVAAETVQAQRLAADRLTTRANRADAEVQSAVRDLERSTNAIAALATVAELAAQRVTAASLATDLAAATAAARQAQRAAHDHRDSATARSALAEETRGERALATLAGEHAAVTRRLAATEGDLRNRPDRDQCQSDEATARHLAEVLQACETAEQTAERSHTRAASELGSAQTALTAARHELSRVRDRLAHLGAPAPDGAAIAHDWQRLGHWATTQRAALQSEQAEVSVVVSRCQQTIAETTEATADRIEELLAESIAEQPFRRLGELLAARESSARSALDVFDASRVKHAARQQKVDTLREAEAVARKLGLLLRSDGFEGWLMQAALEQLASRATERLFELSGGQYSLVLQDRAFAVRDHNNADEIRSARTLSGGETFLASLSLALALSATTAELAAEGSPVMESMFLDEGFGTLDPNTLDTVACAIEELGATGRMVGVVTHIRELADRIPVRLEVTKSGGSSRVERVDGS